MLAAHTHFYLCRPIRIISGNEIKLAVDLGFNTWSRQRFRLHGIQLTSTADPTSAQHALTSLISSVQRPPDDKPPAPPPLILRSLASTSGVYEALLFTAAELQELSYYEFDLSINSVLLENHPELFRARAS